VLLDLHYKDPDSLQPEQADLRLTLTPRKAPTPTPDPIPTQDIQQYLLKAHNDARSQQHLPPLHLDQRLNVLARSHNDWMIRTNTMAHDEPGNSFNQRVTNSGIFYRSAGENIAYGYPTVEAVFTGWMNSPGHKANILNSLYNVVGFAQGQSSKGVSYWTADFMYVPGLGMSLTSKTQPLVHTLPGAITDSSH
jgi:uncharacterized protein YkwD